MGDFSKWPIQSATVNRLRLDPENPRLATSVKRPTQQELIADLLDHEDVIGLVRDIARQGFFPNDLLVAIRDDSKTIVVEGNRRLAALKLLLNPELAPPSYQKRIRQYAAQSRTTIEKIQIVLAPNRNAAVPIIIARHMAVTKYLQDSGDLKAIRAKFSSKQPKPPDWIPTLKQQLDYILQTNTIPLAPEGRKALRKFISDTQQSLTLDSLNWFTHNRYVPPTVEQMRAFWTMLTPLLELTLQSVQ